LQRRHQKLFEETPAQISAAVRERLREAGIRAAQAIRYDSVGTIETLVAGDEFFFLEMNTRIQVEHTISEMVSGLDLIREQIRVAAGEPLGYGQDAIVLRGHAIEVRVNAEDPAENFAPAPGTLTAYQEPAGLGIRVDSAASLGGRITPDYDSMIAKLIVWAPDREQAHARLRRAIDDFKIGGVPTTLAFARALSYDPAVVDGSFGTATLEGFAATYRPEVPVPGPSEETPAAVSDVVRVEVNNKLFFVRVLDKQTPATGAVRSAARAPMIPKRQRNGKLQGASDGNTIVAPMHGLVVTVMVEAGQDVVEGQVVAVIEAMKMMNEIRAHRSGSVEGVHVDAGTTVEAGTKIVSLA
jgi:acetyl-CoA/propionyl-CoA carboxylase biotin carboxyl carrier protein